MSSLVEKINEKDGKFRFVAIKINIFNLF